MYYVEKQKKYRNKSTFYNGYWYGSLLEANHARELDLLIRAEDSRQRVSEWKRQFKVELRVNGTFICNHYVDFWVRYADGSIELHETKGYATEVWKMKVKLMEATFLKEHPEIEYKVFK